MPLPLSQRIALTNAGGIVNRVHRDIFTRFHTFSQEDARPCTNIISAAMTRPTALSAVTATTGVTWRTPMINYHRLAMMAGTAVVALSTTTLPVHAIPEVSGKGYVATNAAEGVLINYSYSSFPGQLIPPGHLNGECTGVLVSNEPSTNKTRAVLTAGHCIYEGLAQELIKETPVHWDVGAPYANENKLHPSFGLKVSHHVDRAEKRDVAEPYPDWKTWTGGVASEKREPSNINFLHDIGLICLGEPIATKLGTLDTSTPVYPYNTVDATRGLRTTVVALGRVNNVDPKYPPGFGHYQDLFRSDDLQTAAVKQQSLPDESYLKIRNEFLVPIPNLGNLMDEGDSGGPAFLAGTHRVVGLTSRNFTEFDEVDLPEKAAVGFSRLNDPLVAAWLKYEIQQCNNTGSLDGNRDNSPPKPGPH